MRYCNINPIFDTEFSLGVRISHQKHAPISSQASIQNIVSHRSKTALVLVKRSFTAVRVNILKTCLRTYRNRFLIENSNAGRKFSINDRVYVGRSQNLSKSAKRFRFKTRESWSLKNVCFFVALYSTIKIEICL